MLLHHVYKTNVNEEEKLKRRSYGGIIGQKTVVFQSVW